MLIFLCVTKRTVCRDDTKTNMTDRCIASSLEWQWLGAGRLVYSLTAFQWSLSLSFAGDGVSFNLMPCASQLLFCSFYASIMYERVSCTYSACGGAFSFGGIFMASLFLPFFHSLVLARKILRLRAWRTERLRVTVSLLPFAATTCYYYYDPVHYPSPVIFNGAIPGICAYGFRL